MNRLNHFCGDTQYSGCLSLTLAAQQSSAIDEIKKSDARITSLENRTTILESGIGQLQLKIDGIKEDLSLIKSAVIK